MAIVTMNFSIDSKKINSLLNYYLPELLQWRGVNFDDEAEIDEWELMLEYKGLEKHNAQNNKLDLKTYLLEQVKFKTDLDKPSTSFFYDELAFLFLCIAHAKYLSYKNNEFAIYQDGVRNLLQLAILAKIGDWGDIEINVAQAKSTSSNKKSIYSQPAKFRHLGHFASTKTLINLLANIYNINSNSPELLKIKDSSTTLEELIELKKSLSITIEVKQKQIEANGALMIASYLNDHSEMKFRTGKRYSSAQVQLIYHVYHKLGWQKLSMDLALSYVDRFSKEINRLSNIIN